MISTETELKADVREMTGYTSTLSLSDDGLDTAYRSAKRHIKIRESPPDDFDFYDTENGEGVEALFWFTCLFVKVQTGELDSQDIQVGAIEVNSLLSKEDSSEETLWYRRAESALESLSPSNAIRSTSPIRSEREYETGTYDDQEGGSSDVDETDI